MKMESGYIMAECAVIALSASALSPEPAWDQLVLVRLRIICLCPFRADELLCGHAVLARPLALVVLVGIIARLRPRLEVLPSHLRIHRTQIRGHTRLKLLRLGGSGIPKLVHYIQDLGVINTSSARGRKCWLGSLRLR